MHFTIFDTPVVRDMLYWISKGYLRMIGWKKQGQVPDLSKMVMIAAPHTTNWDMPITMAIAFVFRIKVYWMGKDTLFKRPFGAVMKWLGGIPVDRSAGNDVVQQSIRAFEKNENLVIIVPPEGTRGKVSYWKTGFYRIASGAGVPIVLGFLDYRKKAGGIGPTIYPSGDMDLDMKEIRSFYGEIAGKYPDKTSYADVSPSSKGRSYRDYK
ncbi:MAG: lysophospholipid acyltransferase family protein [Thermodesulfobacteriota bacterium]|nr:lysophospholipid acyltransferase family protein [Thermodesulfobacteriota bacterium]